MRYCDEAKINCDNCGGAITFDLAIFGQKKEKKENGRKGKKMKKSVEEFVCTKNPVSGKNPVNQESQALLSTIGGR